jgi:resolvase-like protein
LIRLSRFFIYEYREFDAEARASTPADRIRRVSTHNQNLEMQLDALKKTGCKRIFTDKLSGERPVTSSSLKVSSSMRSPPLVIAWTAASSSSRQTRTVTPSEERACAFALLVEQKVVEVAKSNQRTKLARSW